ncbi:MAG: methyltransferase [Acidobacteriaceae bacterium]
MMQATEFEFRNRWWLFGMISGTSFSLLAFDHVPAGGRIAGRLMPAMQLSETNSLHIVFSIAALIMIAAALLRTWGSSYLGRDVVHDRDVHSEALHADGPYRHVRNPLYLGNVLMAFAMGMVAPVAGWLLMIIGITLFSYRLIAREEVALASEQGDAYRAFMRAVPRLCPAITARIPASGGTPDWISGFAAEAFFWSFTLGVVGLALSLNILWFYAGLVASPLLSWLAGLAMRKHRKPSVSA